MTAAYDILAPIYDRIGLSSYSEAVTPRLLDYVQRNGWMGRRILDLGCGTGKSLYWFGKRTYSISGVDNSAEMLRVARTNLATGSLSAQLHQQDIRNLSYSDPVDLALALNLINDFDTLRDLEAVFRSVIQILEKDRLFVFDMTTIEGLSSGLGETIAYDQDDLTVFSQTRYDYERQAQVRRYLVYIHQDMRWQRKVVEQTLRGFPIQAVGALLQRSGFALDIILTDNLTPYETGAAKVMRVYFVARKQ